MKSLVFSRMYKRETIDKRRYKTNRHLWKLHRKTSRTNSKRIEMQAIFCLKHLSQTILAIRWQSVNISQHWIKFERLSLFTSNFSSSSSFITACRSRENSSIFETIKILKHRLIEIREIREVMSDKTTRKERAKTKKLNEETLT